jgi:calcineurin-like phosphoesterase family protein
MRTLAIGDIHGCLRALDAILDMVQPQPDDLVILLGDYVDRGPDSRGVIDRILELQTRCRLITLRGNHEVMMLKARTDYEALCDWLMCGGREALASYAPNGGLGEFDDVPTAHWEFFEATRPFFEIDTHFFVHANVYPEMPLDEQPDYMLYWEKFLRDTPPHVSGKTMICGHTAQRSGIPLDLGHAVCIDTCVYGAGWLTCLDVATGKLWQARETGENRTGHLGTSLPEVE